MWDDSLLLTRAQEYAKSRGIALLLQQRLGHGSDGSVWATDVDSAVKSLYRGENYERELECYRRLQRAGIRKLGRFSVPWLEGWDDALQVIEMGIVHAPYVLDFGKVHLDRPPEYFHDAEFRRRSYEEWRERFGKQWTTVAFVLEQLKRVGIYYVDPRPSNIDTGEEGDDESWLVEQQPPPTESE